MVFGDDCGRVYRLGGLRITETVFCRVWLATTSDATYRRGKASEEGGAHPYAQATSTR